MKDSEVIKKGEGIIQEMLKLTQVEATAKVSMEVDEEDNKYLKVDVSGDDLGYLIGYKGMTLNSLQSIFGQILSKEIEDIVTVSIDINNYRAKRKDYLVSLAQRAMQEALDSGQNVELPPLSAYERRVIHMTLKSEEGVTTESEGEGFDRHVVIKIVKK
ncbi:protein jag [Patescibacteria group bacterium]